MSTIQPTLVTVGTISAGVTPIQADVGAGLGSALPVKVTLSTDYTLQFPPGWPQRPGYDGSEYSRRPNPILSGTTFAFLKPEADALVNAGAATYA